MNGHFIMLATICVLATCVMGQETADGDSGEYIIINYVTDVAFCGNKWYSSL